MLENKPWFLSRTILASLVTVVLSLCGLYGLPEAALEEEGALTDALLQAATAIAGLVAIVGRLRADKRIG